ncbi:FMN-binding protein [Arthrobacter sp. SLBN-112]|uniref:FMN-binding protein n=1 Tax=Arthrobacter sp. SLBN-112 TaxID=2768452 RepID=UPI0027B4DBD0|nr:FMN-binding protein [Arthrobacter sp. SLBN-112]MDQ0799337.1 uncharacterized protein with FMN-binding domain [Arthrobacter sp. SLBN-112]
MKIRGIAAAAFASAGILLAGWQAGTQVSGISTVATGTTAAGTTGATGTGSSGAGSSGATGSSSTSGSSGSTASGIYKGTAVQTRFGPVQVQITVANGKITDVTALQLTNTDGKSIQISNRAAPLLRSEALAAQSASIKTISGATVTSSAYVTSLQAAIDAAHL